MWDLQSTELRGHQCLKFVVAAVYFHLIVYVCGRGSLQRPVEGFGSPGTGLRSCC